MEATIYIWNEYSIKIIFFLSYELLISAGVAIFSILVNSVVHVLMYSYYFLSIFNNLQHRLRPIKPYITVIQMVSQHLPHIIYPSHLSLHLISTSFSLFRIHKTITCALCEIITANPIKASQCVCVLTFFSMACETYFRHPSTIILYSLIFGKHMTFVQLTFAMKFLMQFLLWHIQVPHLKCDDLKH